jgi:hypothetical protein
VTPVIYIQILGMQGRFHFTRWYFDSIITDHFKQHDDDLVKWNLPCISDFVTPPNPNENECGRAYYTNTGTVWTRLTHQNSVY